MFQELFFWQTHRKTEVRMNESTYSMFQYRAASNAPRPESFKEDVQLVNKLKNNTAKKEVWSSLASAAESGWDFSSRWFKNATEMETIETNSIIPVDLNAIMCYNMNIMSYFFDEINNLKKAKEYRTKYGVFRSQFQRVFYVKEERGWFDYNLRTKKHNLQFYPSIITPLFTKCYHSLNHRQAEQIFDTMEEKGAFKFLGGIPTR